MSTDTLVANGPVADAVAEGVIGGRLWFYANYHCNLECTYCLTESGPKVRRRMIEPAVMLDIARQARDLGFTDLGVTGGEPFMLSSMPDTIHTSPSHVESAARLPSEKKSRPPKRMRRFHGLSTGGVSRSRTYGPLPVPSTPLVATTSGQ